MREEPPQIRDDQSEQDPALTPLGVSPLPQLRSREGDIIHTAPEFAIAEDDVHTMEDREYFAGSSLWKDAWRRLLKNKLAVFGLIVIIVISITSLLRPPIIQAA